MLIPLILSTTAALAGTGPIIDDTPYRELPEIAFPFVEHNQSPRLGLASPTRLYPAPGEEGHYTAVRFDAGAVEWDVRWIEFYAPNSTDFGVTCTTDLDREVKLFVTSGTNPPANPTILSSQTVPARATRTGSVNQIHVDLDTPVEVAPGESLWVAIEMPGSYRTGLGCLSLGALDDDENDYWSNATGAPYSWQILEDFAIFHAALVSIGGYEVY